MKSKTALFIDSQNFVRLIDALNSFHGMQVEGGLVIRFFGQCQRRERVVSK